MTRKTWTRKNWHVAAAAGAGLSLAMAGCGSSDDSTSDGGASDDGPPRELVVTSFGGDWEATLIEAVVEPFEEEHNAEVTLVTAYSADALAQMTAQKSNPQYDVVHFSGGQESQAAAESMLEPIAPEDLSNYDDLVPQSVVGLEDGIGPVVQVSPIGIVYRTDQLDDVPTSWQDVLNPDYAEHVALTDLSNSYGMLSLLGINEALGGDAENLAPGMDALTSLAQDGDAIVVETSAEIQQAFAQRDIWIAPYSQDYAETLRKADLPVEFVVPDEGAPASYITANVVSGRDNADLAKAFVDYELRPEVQAAWAEALLYSPTNVQSELPAEIADRVVHGDDFGNLVRYDSGVLAEKAPEWTNEWNERISQ